MFRLRMLWITNTLKLNTSLYASLFSIQQVLVGVIWGLFYFVTPNLPLGEDFWFVASLLASVLVQLPAIFMVWKGIGTKLNKLYELTFPNCYAFTFKKFYKRDIAHLEILKEMNKYLLSKSFVLLVKAETQDTRILDQLTFVVAPVRLGMPSFSGFDPREFLGSKSGAWVISLVLMASAVILAIYLFGFVFKSTFLLLSLGVVVLLFAFWRFSKKVTGVVFYTTVALVCVFLAGAYLTYNSNNVSTTEDKVTQNIPVVSAQQEITVPAYDEAALIGIGTGQVTQNLSQMATKVAKTSIELFRDYAMRLETENGTRVPWKILLEATGSEGVGLLERDSIVQEWFYSGYRGVDENNSEMYYAGSFSTQVMNAVYLRALDPVFATAYIDAAKSLADYSAIQVKFMTALAQENPDFVFAASLQGDLNAQAQIFNNYSDVLGLLVLIPQLDIVSIVEVRWDPGVATVYQTATPLPAVVYSDSLNRLLQAQTATAAPTSTPLPPTETPAPAVVDVVATATEVIDYSQIPGSIVHGMNGEISPTRIVYDQNAQASQLAAGIADPYVVCKVEGFYELHYQPSSFVPNKWANWSDILTDVASGQLVQDSFMWIPCANGGAYAVNYIVLNVGTPWTVLYMAPPLGLPRDFNSDLLRQLLSR